MKYIKFNQLDILNDLIHMIIEFIISIVLY